MSAPRLLRAFSALSLLASCLASQTQTIVSPLGRDVAEGNSGTVAPFNDAVPRHFLQIHSDLKSTSARVIQKIAWRRDGGSTPGTGTRALDLQLTMGHTREFDACTWVFANNYVLTTPQVVVPRQIVNLGPATSTSAPPPFEIAIPLNVPFVYFGTASLGWEVSVFSATTTGAFPAAVDAHYTGITLGANTPTTVAGCTTPGQVFPIVATPSFADNGGTFVLGVAIDRAPQNQPALLALGASNPNLSVPGLCGLVATDLLVTLPMGTTDATGFLGGTSNGIKYPAGEAAWAFPNTLPGARLYLQAHILHPSAPGAIKLANSDGKYLTVPTLSGGSPVQVTRLYNAEGGASVPNAICFGTGNVAFGLVTEFTF